jgi:hypothetical protein
LIDGPQYHRNKCWDGVLGARWDLLEIDQMQDAVLKYMRVHQHDEYLFSTIRMTFMFLDEGAHRQDPNYREHVLHNSSVSREVYMD